MFPEWMRIGLILALSLLTLAYLAAPLFGVKATMPPFLEVCGGGSFAAVLGRYAWRGLIR